MQGKAKVFRYDPTVDRHHRYQEFTFELEQGMTVLDVLNQIYERTDDTLCYSYGCRFSHCGQCGLMVNGVPALACRRTAEPEMLLEPLRNIPVLKDLVIDREEYVRRCSQLRLFLERSRKAFSEPESIDTKKFEWFKTASRCVECFCCLAICPVYSKNPHSFAGPTALILEARHCFDPRDELNRKLILTTEGIAHCTQCGLCSKVCGLGADPTEVIKHIYFADTKDR